MTLTTGTQLWLTIPKRHTLATVQLVATLALTLEDRVGQLMFVILAPTQAVLVVAQLPILALLAILVTTVFATQDLVAAEAL